MLLVQAQVRQLADISEETFRTWRDKFPDLVKRKGAAAFDLADVVALRIINLMVNALSLKVSTIATHGKSLFEHCRKAAGPLGGAEYLLFDANGFRPAPASTELRQLDTQTIVLPLQSTIREMRDKLVTFGFQQPTLPFGALAKAS